MKIYQLLGIIYLFLNVSCKKDMMNNTTNINSDYKLVCPTKISKDCNYIEGSWFEINSTRYPLILPNATWYFTKTTLQAPWGNPQIEISFDCSKITYRDHNGIYQGESKIIGLNDSLMVLEDPSYKSGKIILMRIGIPAVAGPISYINQDHLERFLNYYCLINCKNSSCLYSFSYVLNNSDVCMVCDCPDGSTGKWCGLIYKRVDSKEKNFPLAYARSSDNETFIFTSGTYDNDDNFEILHLTKNGDLANEYNISCKNCQDSLHEMFYNGTNSLTLIQGSNLVELNLVNKNAIKIPLKYIPDSKSNSNFIEGPNNTLIYYGEKKLCMIDRITGVLMKNIDISWVQSVYQNKMLVYSKELKSIGMLINNKLYLFDENLAFKQSNDFKTDYSFQNCISSNGFIVRQVNSEVLDNQNRIMYPKKFEVFDLTLKLVQTFFIPSNVQPWISSCIFESNKLVCSASGYGTSFSDQTKLKSDIFKFIKWDTSGKISIFLDYIIPSQFEGIDGLSKTYSSGPGKYSVIGLAGGTKNIFQYNIDEFFSNYEVDCK